MTKKNILFVGDYNRQDYLDLLQSSRNDFNFYFLEFASPAEVKNDYYKNYGNCIFWKDYRDAFDLLAQLKPDKVLFLFIEAYNHVVLNLACKAIGIYTYHLDHGVRDIHVNIMLEHYYKSRKQPFWLHTQYKKLQQLKPRIITRLFLIRTLNKLPPSYAAYAKHFIRIRKGHNYIDTHRKVPSPLRLADAYISYSRKTFETHKIVDALPDFIPNHIIGIPNFDVFANLQIVLPTHHSLLFVDAGFTDEKLLGWNFMKYKTFVNYFMMICSKYGYDVYVKLHPRQANTAAVEWLHHKNVTVIDNNELMQRLPQTKLIIGFFSTLLLPIIAFNHTTVITLENHPIGRIDVSKSFIEAGVAHPIYDLTELHDVLENIEELHRQQLPHKQKFTEEWMYKFDGKSGERLRQVLLADGL